MPETSVMWFRRDLRLRDSAALAAAASAGATVPLFVLDPGLWPSAGPVRQAWLARSLRALDDSMSGGLLLRHGRPEEQVVETARAAGADTVFISAESEPYGAERDGRVEAALAEHGIRLVREGSPYAVTPGKVRRGDGEPYSVYTPFYRQWREQADETPIEVPGDVNWVRPLPSEELPAEPELGDLQLPEAGEAAALARWGRFVDERLGAYASSRDRPDLDGTSSMSAHLKYGEVHPRTLLADLARIEAESTRTGAAEDVHTSAEKFRGELAWREFYADVLLHHPESVDAHLKPDVGVLSDATGPAADAAFAAWAEGRTGYPIVDAGMRQLRAVGWIHNRVRMIVASFLIKDLHVDWRRGAEHFFYWLRDGDVASNTHGWQWVAGTGTDPAPYFRIFNPVKQGLQFDPDGAYVRKYVPELREVAGAAVHEPWRLPSLPPGYPERIVDHAEERKESLRRFEARARG